MLTATQLLVLHDSQRSFIVNQRLKRYTSTLTQCALFTFDLEGCLRVENLSAVFSIIVTALQSVLGLHY